VQRVATILLALAAASSSGAAGAHGADRALGECPAALVHHEPNPALGTLSGGRWIATWPASNRIIGYLWGGEELNGRFAVYAGGQNPRSRTSEKVLWAAPEEAPAGPRLRIKGRRLRLDRRTGLFRATDGSFTQNFAPAHSEQTPGQLFPSIIRAPRAGCWKLTLRTGRLSASAIAIIQPLRGR
jgi:hypothetical protein